MLDFYEDINKYKNKNGNQECWINLVSPSEGELQIVSNKTGIPLEILQYPLDEDETSRINVRENIILIIIDIPFSEVNDNSLIYDTYPLGIVYTDHYLITICLKNSKIISDFFKPQSICTFEKTNLILQIVNNVYTYYSLYLKQINSKSLLIEKYLFKAVKNNQLLQLYSLRKSLVYFSTSLKSNELTLEKMLRLGIIKDEDNKELLSNILIEHKQTIEMTNMYNLAFCDIINFLII